MNKLMARVGATIVIFQVLLFILSWIFSAMRLEGVRSLLSSEGIRWFFGAFAGNVASSWLVSLLLILIALGALQKSGIFDGGRGYRDRIALRVSIIVLCLFGMVVGLLTLPPHAILLSATGELFPSAFSRSLLPIITFAVSLFAVVFGMMSGRLNTLSDILGALSNGLSRSAPLVVIAILLIQFIASLGFVFN
jgi:aminobenzoyl-glutamate transport protein